MMSEIEPVKTSPKWRKALLQLAGGAVFGGMVGFGVGHLSGGYIRARGLEDLPRSVEIAGLVAIIYILVALILLAGSMNPALGAKLLNVEDEDEVHELRSQLSNSGVAMVLWGAALLALALAAPVGPLATPVALAIALAGLVIGTWFAWKTYRAADELMSAMNLEAGALSYGLVLVVLGGWGMLAHLGLVAGPQPLDLLTACYVLVMAATFIAVGRRGMLMPR